MLRQGFIASLLLVNSFVFSATLSAQTSSVEGNVVGEDGRQSGVFRKGLTRTRGCPLPQAGFIFE
jgi:hypothetical protein